MSESAEVKICSKSQVLKEQIDIELTIDYTIGEIIDFLMEQEDLLKVDKSLIEARDSKGKTINMSATLGDLSQSKDQNVIEIWLEKINSIKPAPPDNVSKPIVPQFQDNFMKPPVGPSFPSGPSIPVANPITQPKKPTTQPVHAPIPYPSVVQPQPTVPNPTVSAVDTGNKPGNKETVNLVIKLQDSYVSNAPLAEIPFVTKLTYTFDDFKKDLDKYIIEEKIIVDWKEGEEVVVFTYGKTKEETFNKRTYAFKALGLTSGSTMTFKVNRKYPGGSASFM